MNDPPKMVHRSTAETIAEAFVKKRKGKKVSKETLDLLNAYTEVWKK